MLSRLEHKPKNQIYENHETALGDTVHGLPHERVWFSELVVNTSGSGSRLNYLVLVSKLFTLERLVI